MEPLGGGEISKYIFLALRKKSVWGSCILGAEKSQKLFLRLKISYPSSHSPPEKYT